MKTHTHKFYVAVIVTMLLVCVLALTGCNDDEPTTKDTQTVTRIAVIVDESGSFQKYLPTAAAIIQRFIRENAVAGSAEVYLISADRAPRVIAYYEAEKLLDKTGAGLLGKITAINPLDGTDIDGALSLAVEKLTKNNGTKPGKQYLLCFSDMFADRQTNPKVEFKPLDAFDWKSLQGMSPQFYFVDHKNELFITDLLQKAGVSGLVLDEAESRKVKPSEKVDGGEE